MSSRWNGLSGLDGPPDTRFSAGYRSRAKALQRLVGDAHLHLTQGLGTDFAPVVVLADATDWTRGGDEAPPYGIPYASAHEQSLVVAAERRTSPIVRAYAAHGAESQAERFADLVAIHELGHLHVRAMGLDLPEGWLGEFLATYLCCCFLVDHRPEDAELWYSLSRAHAEASKPEHRSLESLDELYFGVGPDNYIWYQSALTMMVERVQPTLGLRFALQLASAGLEFSSDHPSMLAAAEAVYPGFHAWADSLRDRT